MPLELLVVLAIIAVLLGQEYAASPHVYVDSGVCLEGDARLRLPEFPPQGTLGVTSPRQGAVRGKSKER
jgi:hypothetical protein